MLKIELTKSSGAVSPIAREIAITVPVTIPPSALGRTTPRTVRQRLAPSASAPSRWLAGTSRSTSWVERVISGSITIESAIEPAQPRCGWP